jgi:biopolymer transport protein ExbD
MARKKPPTRCKPELNITSMLDVVLNLIMFFILITNFASASLPPEVKAPKLENSVATDKSDMAKVMLNVRPTDQNTGEVKDVLFANKPYLVGNLSEVTEALKREKAINDDVAVTLRADRNIRFEQIQPVMTAITLAGIKTVNLVAEVAR